MTEYGHSRLSTCVVVCYELHGEAGKKNHFSFMNKSLIRNATRKELVLLLLMNIIVDVTYLISGIYTISKGYCAESVA